MLTSRGRLPPGKASHPGAGQASLSFWHGIKAAHPFLKSVRDVKKNPNHMTYIYAKDPPQDLKARQARPDKMAGQLL